MQGVVTNEAAFESPPCLVEWEVKGQANLGRPRKIAMVLSID